MECLSTVTDVSDNNWCSSVHVHKFTLDQNSLTDAETNGFEFITTYYTIRKQTVFLGSLICSSKLIKLREEVCDLIYSH